MIPRRLAARVAVSVCSIRQTPARLASVTSVTLGSRMRSECCHHAQRHVRLTPSLGCPSRTPLPPCGPPAAGLLPRWRGALSMELSASSLRGRMSSKAARSSSSVSTSAETNSASARCASAITAVANGWRLGRNSAYTSASGWLILRAPGVSPDDGRRLSLAGMIWARYRPWTVHRRHRGSVRHS